MDAMYEYKLTPKNHKDFEKFKKCNTSIFELYKKLYNLEIHGKKETEEYQKNLKYLKIAIEVMYQIYNRCGLSIQKDMEWSKNIVNNLPHNYSQNVDAIVKLDEMNIITRRMLGIFLRKIKNANNSYDSNTLSKLEKYSSKLSLDYISLGRRYNFNGCMELIKAMEFDILTLYLIFLNDLKEKYSNNNEIVEGIIKSKYYLSYIDEKFEDMMIENNFELPKEIKFKSQSIANIFNIEDTYKTLVQDGCIVNMIVKEFQKLINNSIPFGSVNKNLQLKIFRETLAKAYLVMLSDKELSKLKSFVISNITKEINSYDSIQLDGIQSICNIFKEISSYKNKTEEMTSKSKIKKIEDK